MKYIIALILFSVPALADCPVHASCCDYQGHCIVICAHNVCPVSFPYRK